MKQHILKNIKGFSSDLIISMKMLQLGTLTGDINNIHDM